MRPQPAQPGSPNPLLSPAGWAAGAFVVLLLGCLLVAEAACVVQGALLLPGSLFAAGEAAPLLDLVRAPLERLYAVVCLLGPLVAARARILAGTRPSVFEQRNEGPFGVWLARFPSLQATVWALGWAFGAPLALVGAWLALGGTFAPGQALAAGALYAASILLVQGLPSELLAVLAPRVHTAALATAVVATATDRLLQPGALHTAAGALLEALRLEGLLADEGPRATAARLWLAAMVGAALMLTWIARRGEPPRLRTALAVVVALTLAALSA